MASHTIKFDPSAGVAYGVNLKINAGATFSDSFTVTRTDGTAFDFTSWTASSQMAKSVSVGSTSYAVATFSVGFTSTTEGKFISSISAAQTRNLVEGRYVYEILVSSGTTVYRLAEGNVLVIPGISSAP